MNAAEYDAWYDSDRGRWVGEVEYSLVIQRLKPQAGDRLLDVGCGTGWFTRRLSGLPGISITGVDIDQYALAFARKRDSVSRYVHADARELPFQDQQFESVLSITALSFVDPWESALSEIIRVCSKHFVIGLLNHHSMLWCNKGQHGGVGAYRGAHWHTAKELRAAMARHPVHNIRIESAIFFPSGSRFARLAEKVIPSSIRLGSFLLISGDRLTR